MSVTRCWRCKGKGRYQDGCTLCNGKGWRKRGGAGRETEDCGQCKGSGTTPQVCISCNGSGEGK